MTLVDPTGHRECGRDCDEVLPHERPAPAAATPIVVFTGDGWDDSETATIESAALEVGQAYARVINQRNLFLWQSGKSRSYRPVTSRQAFLAVHGGPVLFTITRNDPSLNWLGRRSAVNTIEVNMARRGGINRMWVFHELGHDFNASLNGVPYDALSSDGIFKANGDRIAGTRTTEEGGGYLRTFEGFQSSTYPYIQNNMSFNVNEDFADTFSNWVAQSYERNSAGIARNTWMNQHMSLWMGLITAQN